jgi:futalosine hydrolase
LTVNTDICKMNILIAAATAYEIQPTIDFIDSLKFSGQKNQLNLVITGIGGLATSYHLSRFIHEKKPDYCIQAGIAGSFDPAIPTGAVVGVAEEIMGDLGVEESNEFKDVFDLGLMDANELPFREKILKNPAIENTNYGLRLVRSIGINEITTRKERIELLRKKFMPNIESMEGAAFHYVCLQQQIPFIQVRAISNYVGERNKSNWKLNEAVGNLNEKIIEIISSLQ